VIIVTGGAGFIGSAFIWKLNSVGIGDILIVDRLGSSDKWKNLINRRYADYINKNNFLGLLDDNNSYFKATAVIHMGACTSTTERDADYLIENNYHYSRTLAEWSLKNNIPFIYASSAATYGDGSHGFSDEESTLEILEPLNMYAYSKHIFDLWASRNKLLGRITGIKFFNVFGPNEYHKGDMISMAYRAFQQIRESGSVKLFKSYRGEYRDGEQLRDFIYVKDCVEVMWWLFQNPHITGIYNLGTGKARTWNDLIRASYSALGKEPAIEYIEMPKNMRDHYQYFTEASITRLRDAGCTYSFQALEDAVSDYVSNYLKEGECCL
jgi:ADP-L-glycero-D-manno-heptose 6-epimerase